MCDLIYSSISSKCACCVLWQCSSSIVSCAMRVKNSSSVFFLFLDLDPSSFSPLLYFETNACYYYYQHVVVCFTQETCGDRKTTVQPEDRDQEVQVRYIFHPILSFLLSVLLKKKEETREKGGTTDCKSMQPLPFRENLFYIFSGTIFISNFV